MKKNKLWFIFCLLTVLVLPLQAQELNAKLTINSDKIQSTNKQVFKTLQTALNEFINNKRWTNATFDKNERIDCTFTIIISEWDENSTFSGEIQVQVRRPVYNSNYTTTVFNFRDTEFNFEYQEFEPLEYSETSLQSNLTAVICYYIYMALGFDFDTFSSKGGTPFFQQAQQIVTLAQSQPSWNGWKAFDSSKNRHALITALTENQGDTYRQFWYDYHRKGLDEMAANPDRGRANIAAALPSLKTYKSARPNSVLLQMFVDAKLDELISIYSKATNQEKQDGYEMLSNMFPTQSTRLEKLKE